MKPWICAVGWKSSPYSEPEPAATRSQWNTPTQAKEPRQRLGW